MYMYIHVEKNRLTAAFKSKTIVELPYMPRPEPELDVNVLAPIGILCQIKSKCNITGGRGVQIPDDAYQK